MPRLEDQQSLGTNECDWELQLTRSAHTYSQPVKQINKNVEISSATALIAIDLLALFLRTYVAEELKSSIFTAKHAPRYGPRM